MTDTTTTATALPTWDEMTDVDRGCALLHVWKRSWEGVSYATREYPAKYMDDPRLLALSPREACEHAAQVAGHWTTANDRLGFEQVDRLYNLALAEPDRRCLWAVRDERGNVRPQPTEQAARELLAAWARNDTLDPRPAWWNPGDPAARRVMRRDEPGGEWTEAA